MKKLILIALLSAAVLVAQPAIRQDRGVLNASSYASDIARGSWFVVFGTNMGPASLAIYSGSAPYPVEFSGTKVTFTPAAGGAAIEARIWYTSAGQLAALLPSSAAAGDYDVKVTHNNQTSAAYRVKVVDRSFGFATAAQNGAGVPQATNASLNSGVSLVRFTTGSISFSGRTWQYRPAYPGETLILWGTGLGADPQSDLTGGTSGDQTAAGQVRVLVGGMEVTPAYAGRSSGSPGLDQINFTLPPAAPVGCTTSIQVVAGGRYSNLGTLPIASSGSGACQHPYLTQTQLQTLDSGGTVTIGGFSMSRSITSFSFQGMSFDSTSESVGGSFSKCTADQLTYAGGLEVAQIGSCYVSRQRGTVQDIQSGPTISAADAGAQLLLNGPNASNKAILRQSGNSYYVDLYNSGVGGFGGTGTPTLAGGNYTIAGSGGAEIGPFSAQSPFPAAFDWTNKASINTIVRNQALDIRWTGGGTEASATVNIVGFSGGRAGGTDENPIYDIGMFVCTARPSTGLFTIPGSVTNYLSPVATVPDGSAIGFLTVTAGGSTTFTAPAVGGGAVPGEFGYNWSVAKSVSVQ